MYQRMTGRLEKKALIGVFMELGPGFCTYQCIGKGIQKYINYSGV